MDRIRTEQRHKPPGATEEVLAEITRKIVENFEVEKIVLFGSHACGEAHPDSDIDLFIVVRSDERPIKLAGLISQAAHPGVVAVDFVVKTPGQVREYEEDGNFFYTRIMKEGRVLYAREGA